MTLIYKILRQDEWAAMQEHGRFDGSAVDLRDDFIHLSGADTVRETAARHFTLPIDLVLVAVEAEALGEALRWEPSRGGALFPHLYAPLPLSAVRSAVPLPLGEDGRHVFPAALHDLPPVAPGTP